MRVLIIEDEKPAAKHLTTLLQRHGTDIVILDRLDTVRKAVRWFENHDAPDLMFMDIQLADGLSFAIFEQVAITSPIIFTTAYDQYAVQAFKVNSVDYLLKPIDAEELARAIDKFKQLHRSSSTPPSTAMDRIQQAVSALTKQYKNRFVVKIGEHIKAISTDEILYFVSQEKATFAQTQSGRRFMVDYPLEQVEGLVDPGRFFRISRQYLVSIEAIRDIVTYSSSRLKLLLHHSEDTSILVSRERVTDFRQWLDQ